MEKYRFVYITGDALTFKMGQENNGTRDIHAVNVIFNPNADYEYDERLDCQIESQEELNNVKNFTVHTTQTTRWE